MNTPPFTVLTVDGRPWLHIPKPRDFWIKDSVWRVCLRNLFQREPTLLQGPTGSGKTELVYLIADATERKIHAVNMGVTTDPRLVLVGTTHYRKGWGTVFYPSEE